MSTTFKWDDDFQREVVSSITRGYKDVPEPPAPFSADDRNRHKCPPLTPTPTFQDQVQGKGGRVHASKTILVCGFLLGVILGELLLLFLGVA